MTAIGSGAVIAHVHIAISPNKKAGVSAGFRIRWLIHCAC
jgi:hypothetical protein